VTSPSSLVLSVIEKLRSDKDAAVTSAITTDELTAVRRFTEGHGLPYPQLVADVLCLAQARLVIDRSTPRTRCGSCAARGTDAFGTNQPLSHIRPLQRVVRCTPAFLNGSENASGSFSPFGRTNDDPVEGFPRHQPSRNRDRRTEAVLMPAASYGEGIVRSATAAIKSACFRRACLRRVFAV
jgi:hypothetical protein